MLLRAEAWTLPTSASFEKITDVPMLAGSSGSRELSSYSDNTLTVSSTWDRFDDIRKSLIRIFDGDTVIDEHEVKRIAKSPRRPSQFQVSGPQANGLVEKLLIYPRTESVDAQDWVWGGENQLPPLGLGDLNNVNEEWHLYSDATSGTMTLTVDGQTTDTFAYNTSDPASIENRIQALSNVTDVTVNGDGTEASPWVIIFYDPPDPSTVTVDDSGLSGGSATLTKEQEGGLDASPITQSQHADQRVDVANHGTYGSPPIIPITQSNLDTDATWALQVNAEGQFAGSQIIISVTPGQTYQASIRVKPSVAGSYRLVIRDIYENLIKATSPFEVSLSAGSYQDLTISDIVIPDGVTEVIMRVAVVSDTPSEIDTFWVNWEAARFDEGMAATTFTEIVRLLLEDAQARGAYEFLDPDFTDTTDTAGNVLEDESFTAFAFSNLGHVMADGSDLSYKWRIRPKATPAGALTHDLQVYLEGEVEDLTASSGGPTVQTGSVDDAAVVSRSPDFTVAVGWGAAGLYAEVEDTALVTEYGRIERVFDVEHLSSVASLERLLNEKFREQAENEDALSAEVPGDAQRVPLIDYAEGSKIWWAFPDEGVEKVAKTVRRVSWTHSDTASFTLQASEVLSEQAGMARAMHHLLRKFERRRRRERRGTPILGGGGGEFSVSVAAADATELEKKKADFVIETDGDDTPTLQAALDRLHALSFNRGGRLALSSGTFNLAPGFSGLFVGTSVTMQGVARFETILATTQTTGTLLELGSGASVRDLTIQGNNTPVLLFLGSDGCDVDGVHFTDATVAINGGNQATITRCTTSSISTFVDTSAGYVGVIVAHNTFNSNGNGVGDIVIGPACDDIQIVGNAMGGHIYTDTDSQRNNLVIVGNQWTTLPGNATAAIVLDGIEGGVIGFNVGEELNAFDFIDLSAVTDMVIIGNRVDDIENGILLDGCDRVIVAQNILGPSFFGQDGIVLTDSDDCEVVDNHVTQPGQNTDDTFDGIRIDGANDPSRNYVHGNRVTAPSSGNTPRYGINVASGTDNIVVANALGAVADYGTDALNDAGTGTVLTYPGHATYGDNFTS